jgi:hypothetical protein
MTTDPLFVKITKEFKLGQPALSVRDAMARWHYSDGHTRRVMDWMSCPHPQYPSPLLKKDTSASPYRWERI